jgi:hypothetical protein
MKNAKQKVSKPQDTPIDQAQVAAPTKEEIREHAHQIYLSRGSVDGRALEDWLQTERKLKAAKDTSAF